MQKKRFNIIISILWITTFLLIVLSCKPFIRMFKKETHLNLKYDLALDVKYVDENSTDIYHIYLDNDIQAITDYLNSLELVEEEIPYNNSSVYMRSTEEYENKLSEKGYFAIELDVHQNIIYFSTDYIAISAYWVCECDTNYYRSFYLKNSGYDPENNTSDFYNFLKEITDKYSK